MRNDTNNYQDNNRKTFYHGKRRNADARPSQLKGMHNKKYSNSYISIIFYSIISI